MLINAQRKYRIQFYKSSTCFYRQHKNKNWQDWNCRCFFKVCSIDKWPLADKEAQIMIGKPGMCKMQLSITQVSILFSSISSLKPELLYYCIHLQKGVQWLSGSVLMTRGRGAAGSSLTCVTALCLWARYINHRLVLVQPRKTRPYITERLLMGLKESNQTKIIFILKCVYCYRSHCGVVDEPLIW